MAREVTARHVATNYSIEIYRDGNGVGLVQGALPDNIKTFQQCEKSICVVYKGVIVAQHKPRSLAENQPGQGE